MTRPRTPSRRVVSAITLALLGAVLAGPTAAAEQPVVPSSAAAEPRARGANGLIAYVRRGQIHTIAADGIGDTVLTFSGLNAAPTWSPDGTQIAYVHRAADGARDLWLMNADGSGQVAVTASGGISTGGAGWSPDGQWLAFGGPCLAADQCSPDDQVLSFIRSSARSGTPITFNPPDGAFFPGVKTVFDRVAWSASGDHLAFGSDSYPSLPDTYLLVYEISTGWLDVVEAVGMSGLTGTLAYPAFNADGTLLAFDAYVDAQGEIWHEGIEMCDYPQTTCDRFRDVLHDTQLTFAPAGDRVALVRGLAVDRIILADPDGSHRSRLTRGSQPSWQWVPKA